MPKNEHTVLNQMNFHACDCFLFHKVNIYIVARLIFI